MVHLWQDTKSSRSRTRTYLKVKTLSFLKRSSNRSLMRATREEKEEKKSRKMPKTIRGVKKKAQLSYHRLSILRSTIKVRHRRES